MDQEHTANATVISLLHDFNRSLYANYERLVQQDQSLDDAHYYLAKLVQTIDAHPGLGLEWENFLNIAGLSRPAFEVVEPWYRASHKTLPSLDSHMRSALCDQVERTDRIASAQKMVIADLKEKVTKCQSEIDRLSTRIAQRSAPAHYYLNMQRCIQADPVVLDAWKTFLMLVTLTVEGPIQGITCDDHSRRHCW